MADTINKESSEQVEGPAALRPLYTFSIGDKVKDKEGVVFTMTTFNQDQVTLVDDQGEESFAHPLFEMLPVDG